MRPYWLLPLTAAIISAAPSDASGQTRAARVTTRTGVYTQPQATRGRDVYTAYCKSCHTPQSHTGAVFNATWSGRNLFDLYAFIRERMPKNEPASLSDQEYVDVMSYLLSMNRMPVGKTELDTDSTRLSTIRIVTVTPQKTSTKSTKTSKGSSP